MIPTVISWCPHWIEGIVTPTAISSLKLFWVLELFSRIYLFISKIKMYYLHPRFPGSTPKFKPQQQQQKSHTHTKELCLKNTSQSHGLWQKTTSCKESGETWILPCSFRPCFGTDRFWPSVSFISIPGKHSFCILRRSKIMSGTWGTEQMIYLNKDAFPFDYYSIIYLYECIMEKFQKEKIYIELFPFLNVKIFTMFLFSFGFLFQWNSHAFQKPMWPMVIYGSTSFIMYPNKTIIAGKRINKDKGNWVIMYSLWSEKCF